MPSCSEPAAAWERLVRATQTAPFHEGAIAEDVIYAFAHGWIELPATTAEGEPSERLSRLYAVKRHAEASHV